MMMNIVMRAMSTVFRSVYLLMFGNIDDEIKYMSIDIAIYASILDSPRRARADMKTVCSDM